MPSYSYSQYLSIDCMSEIPKKGQEVWFGGLRCLIVYVDLLSSTLYISPLGGGDRIFIVSKSLIADRGILIPEESANDLVPA